MSTILKAENITIRFGGLTAVDNATVEIEEGKITCLIGPNGAGKTTMFNSISGALVPTEGKVIFDGKEIQGKKPFQICDAGISRTYQVINLFTNMTCLQNVLVGYHPRIKYSVMDALLGNKKCREEEKAIHESCMEYLEFVGLAHRANDLAGSLPYGEQRLLEVARGLASNPKVILLDEPAAGMNETEKVEFDGLLRRILARGTSVFMIEHDMKLVMGIADKIYVLENGHMISQGTPEEVQNDPVVIKAYLGGDE